MTEHDFPVLAFPEEEFCDGPDESDEVRHVLKALSDLKKKMSSPIIRTCLEEAWADVAHLAGMDEPSPTESDGSEAQPDAA